MEGIKEIAPSFMQAALGVDVGSRVWGSDLGAQRKLTLMHS